MPDDDGEREFADTLRKLVQVPKDELTEEERKYEAMRKRLRDRKEKRKKPPE